MQLSDTISNQNFDPDENLFLIRKRKNQETLLALDFDNSDIINILSGLTEDNYSETLFDNDNDNPPLLNVFGVQINNQEVYIKIKIRSTADNNMVICVSFHWAEHKIKYPYKKEKMK